jgi:hypothetical protein
MVQVVVPAESRVRVVRTYIRKVGTELYSVKGEDFLVHRFRRCGFTKALMCIAVMSPLHRSELLVCIQCGKALVE